MCRPPAVAPWRRKFSRLNVLFICYGTAVEHKSLLNLSGICDGIICAFMYIFVHKAVLSIKTAFNLVKIHLFFRIMLLIQWSVIFCRPCCYCFWETEIYTPFVFRILICWVYFITFIAFCCFIEKLNAKTCVQIEQFCKFTHIYAVRIFCPWSVKPKGGGHDYWFTQGPLNGIEICLMYTATDVYIAWCIQLVIQSESLHFYVSYNIYIYYTLCKFL